MDRGLQITILVGCIVMAFGALSGLGLFQYWGVGADPGAAGDAENITENDAVQDPTVDDGGDSLIDVSVPGVDLLKTLRGWVSDSQNLMENLGLPGALAAPIGVVLSVAIAISIARFIRGV